ncbi:MAG: beta-lactamase family protein [Alistipes sp.]|jgi:CubicO group peptidase (beta-lactamase class C family)|nr:beta-lactamase family protein [Alistipes sp.]
MKKLTHLTLALLLTVASCAPTPKSTANLTPEGNLPRAEASNADFDPAGLADFEAAFRAAEGLEIHSVMVLHHGRVVAEKWYAPGAPDVPHVMHSVSKSFTATAVGFAVAEGLVKLDDKVASFFPDKVPAAPSPHLSTMTVRNLLTMSTGQLEQPSRAGQDWIADFLAAPIDDTPGANFRYNSMATFMLSAIVQKVTGQKIVDYLQPRLFGPLAFTGYHWEESPDGINVGGWGLYIKTEDMAKFGQLFLQNGVWNGEQLLPAGWVEEASTAKIASGPAGNETLVNPDSDWTQGYGYQMWRSRHGAYRADGANGQYIIVIPDSDAVVAITANVRNMQSEIDLVWDHLLPALK